LKKGFNGLNNDQYSEVINTEFYYTGKAKKGLFSQTNDAFFFSENLLSRNNDGFMIHYIDRSNNFCGVHTSCKPSELVVYSCKL
jgi:hypothetical protein